MKKWKSKAIIAIVSLSFMTSVSWALTSGSTLGEWQSAPEDDKNVLAMVVSKIVGRPDLTTEFFYRCITEVAKEPSLANKKILEVGGDCVSMAR